MTPAEVRAELRDTVARSVFRDEAFDLEREQDAKRLTRRPENRRAA